MNISKEPRQGSKLHENAMKKSEIFSFYFSPHKKPLKKFKLSLYLKLCGVQFNRLECKIFGLSNKCVESPRTKYRVLLYKVYLCKIATALSLNEIFITSEYQFVSIRNLSFIKLYKI